MKTPTNSIRALAVSMIALAVVPAMAQKAAVKTDLPPISGNVYLPAGTQNQAGGPMGETGTLLQAPAPVVRAPEPVRVVAAPAPAPAPAPVAAPAPAPAPMPAPAPRVRADRG